MNCQRWCYIKMVIAVWIDGSKPTCNWFSIDSHRQSILDKVNDYSTRCQLTERNKYQFGNCHS